MTYLSSIHTVGALMMCLWSGQLMFASIQICLLIPVVIPVSGRGKGSFCPPELQTGCEDQSVSYPADTTCSFHGIEWLRHAADHSTASSADVKSWFTVREKIHCLYLSAPTHTNCRAYITKLFKRVFYSKIMQLPPNLYWLSFGTCLRATRTFCVNILPKFLTMILLWAQHECTIVWIEGKWACDQWPLMFLC